MFFSNLKREKKTIALMIGLYCRDSHGSSGDLCPDCTVLADYAASRLDKCPYGEKKPACSHCPIHCYKPAMKESIRQVMRYSGPRMPRAYPGYAVLHLLQKLFS